VLWLVDYRCRRRGQNFVIQASMSYAGAGTPNQRGGGRIDIDHYAPRRQPNHWLLPMDVAAGEESRVRSFENGSSFLGRAYPKSLMIHPTTTTTTAAMKRDPKEREYKTAHKQCEPEKEMFGKSK
jgi:hypothetical protein